ncbi:MAG TPA: histidinol-phosphate transaminase, partial [Thermaerobacter sp.]
ARCTAAVAPSPTFGYYATAAAAAGVPYRPVPVPPERAVTLDDLQPVLDALPGEKLVFLCRPNNPTGLSCELEVVEGLLERSDVWLVVDEAYAEYAGESVLHAHRAASRLGARPPASPLDARSPGLAGGIPPVRATGGDGVGAAGSGGPPPASGTGAPRGDLPARETDPSRPRLVVLRTLSKAFALAGARVGYAVATPVVADRLRRWLQPYNVNTLSLVAARVALDHRDVFLRRVEATRRRRDRLVGALGRLPGITPLPSRGNFVLFRVEPASAARPLAEALARRGIAVRAFPWEPSLTGYLRVTVGTEAENQAFLTALAAAWGGGGTSPSGGGSAPSGADQGPARIRPAAGSSGKDKGGWGA